MGYRSDVALMLRNTVEIPLKIKCTDLFNRADLDKGENYTLLTWYYIKWYPDYDQIKLLMEWLTSLNREDYALHILGEELGDYEQRGQASEMEDSDWEIYPTQQLCIKGRNHE